MTRLIELALADEARGRALAHLAAGRQLVDELHSELEAARRELAEAEQRRRAIATRPGDQLRLPPAPG